MSREEEIKKASGGGGKREGKEQKMKEEVGGKVTVGTEQPSWSAAKNLDWWPLHWQLLQTGGPNTHLCDLLPSTVPGSPVAQVWLGWGIFLL